MSRNRSFLLLLLALASGACSRGNEEATASAPAAGAATSARITALAPDSPQLEQIRVAAVQEADTPQDVVTAPGKIEAIPNRVSRVLPPVAGRVTEVLVAVGDRVTAGQPLVVMDSPDADAAISAVLQAEASVNQAGSALLKAQKDVERLRDLYANQAVAQKELLQAEKEEAQAREALKQAEAALRQARSRAVLLGLKPEDFGQKIQVRAPISGKVLDLAVAPGEFRNDLNAPLMTIADLSTVWVTSEVPENMIRFIQPGERVEIELTAYPNEKFVGRVTQIADTVDPQTRTIKVRAEIENAQGRLRPEMYGRIRHVNSMRRLPVVPLGAVIESHGRTVVFVERRPGVFEQVEVSVGERMGDRLPILAGLRPGDRIVVDGPVLLQRD
jgi:cobalt-zinc-cadmium efflux system membrane fusion protein